MLVIMVSLVSEAIAFKSHKSPGMPVRGSAALRFMIRKWRLGLTVFNLHSSVGMEFMMNNVNETISLSLPTWNGILRRKQVNWVTLQQVQITHFVSVTSYTVCTEFIKSLEVWGIKILPLTRYSSSENYKSKGQGSSFITY